METQPYSWDSRVWGEDGGKKWRLGCTGSISATEEYDFILEKTGAEGLPSSLTARGKT
jgi:hypothetical protein